MAAILTISPRQALHACNAAASLYGFRYHASALPTNRKYAVKPYAPYAIGAALVDTEIQVTDEQLSAMNIEKGMMTLVDQALSLIHISEPTRPY